MQTAAKHPTLAHALPFGVELRPFYQLGHANHGWLDAHHHFSFAAYLDRERMGWGLVRVINDDTVAPDNGFDMHPHKDMEIITYVRQGAISHADSLGNHGKTSAGNVQVMSAGTGIVHAEQNDETVPTTLYQIWIYPDTKNVTPRWEAREFPRQPASGQLPLLVTGMEDRANPDALQIHQDAKIYGGIVQKGAEVTHTVPYGYRGYALVAEGAIDLNGVEAHARDGVAIDTDQSVTIRALDDAEVLLIVVPLHPGELNA